MIPRHLFLILLLLLFTVLCDSVFEFVAQAGNKTYMRDASNGTTDFLEFVQLCHQNQMQAATIESPEEQEAITNFYQETQSTLRFWIGGWDMNHEDIWTWITPTSLASAYPGGQEMNYTNWAWNQPDGGVFANCAHLSPTGYGQWWDTLCTNAVTFVPLCQSMQN